MTKRDKRPLLPAERIARAILILRGQKVILDADLAVLYEVETRVLNQAVKRNLDRFPSDFLFRLSPKELDDWRSRLVISNPGARMALRRAPFAFTEHGALMAATVLNSPRAIAMSVYVVRAFVRMRQVISQNEAIAKKLAELEQRVDSQDEVIVEIVRALGSLVADAHPAQESRRKIGFV